MRFFDAESGRRLIIMILIFGDSIENLYRLNVPMHGTHTHGSGLEFCGREDISLVGLAHLFQPLVSH